jgi:hypothetical protein
VAQTYDQILARNLRAARARLGPLGQESVAARMRALGHASWLRQTVSSAEKGRRRLSAAEVFALALVLETSVSALLTATADDESVTFPTFDLGFRSAAQLVSGFTDKAVQWTDDDKPVFTGGKSAWMAGDPDAPDVVKAAWTREDEH